MDASPPVRSPAVTAKIALAQLNEFPDYCTRLHRMEEEAKAEGALTMKADAEIA